jgi:sodium/proline symporter
MLLGTITLIYWKESGLGSTLYEIVPGFLVNVIVIMIGNKIYTQKNKGVLAEFDEVQRIYERDI